MKSIVLILAMIGIIMLAVGYVKSNLQCPPPLIEYRYVDKTFNEEQLNPQPLLSIAGMESMFENDAPFVQNGDYATKDVKYPQK